MTASGRVLSVIAAIAVCSTHPAGRASVTRCIPVVSLLILFPKAIPIPIGPVLPAGSVVVPTSAACRIVRAVICAIVPVLPFVTILETPVGAVPVQAVSGSGGGVVSAVCSVGCCPVVRGVCPLSQRGAGKECCCSECEKLFFHFYPPEFVLLFTYRDSFVVEKM